MGLLCGFLPRPGIRAAPILCKVLSSCGGGQGPTHLSADEAIRLAMSEYLHGDCRLMHARHCGRLRSHCAPVQPAPRRAHDRAARSPWSCARRTPRSSASACFSSASCAPAALCPPAARDWPRRRRPWPRTRCPPWPRERADAVSVPNAAARQCRAWHGCHARGLVQGDGNKCRWGCFHSPRKLSEGQRVGMRPRCCPPAAGDTPRTPGRRGYVSQRTSRRLNRMLPL